MHAPLCGSGWILCIPASRTRASPSPRRSRLDTRDSGACAVVWEWLHLVHISFSHGASLSPKGAKQAAEGLGCICLCVGGIVTLRTLGAAKGRPYLPGSRGTTKETRVYPPLCGSSLILCLPGLPTGRPYPTSILGRTGGTGVHALLCGSV